MFSTNIDIGAIMMIAIIALAFITLIGIYLWVRRNTDNCRQLTRALELSGNLTKPLFVYQDQEDWRIALGEATHEKYGRVKFQTMGIKIGSIKLQIMDLLGRVLEERPLIIA